MYSISTVTFIQQCCRRPVKSETIFSHFRLTSTLLVLIRRVEYITEVSSKLNRKTDNTKYNTQKEKKDNPTNSDLYIQANELNNANHIKYRE